MSASSKLLPFQQCTVDWILKQITDKGREVRRFLVADEVGLGKTKIAAEIINGLLRGRKSLSVVYISSSLDICHQNRKKLCSDPDQQIVQADRICLLYEKPYQHYGLRIISLTPGTSLNLKRGSGNIAERAYIARYLSKRFRIRRETLVSCLKAQANAKNFEERLDDTRHAAAMPPNWVCDAIDRAWENVGVIDELRARSSRDSVIVAKLRQEMARAILRSLKPGLVILDEVQKFPDVIASDSAGALTHSVARELLNAQVPTLLLSATPYKAFVGASQATLGNQHVEELQGVLRFLTASDPRAKRLAGEIAGYAEKVSALTPDNLKDVLAEKGKLEGELKKYMVRAERINFEQESHAPYVEKMMPNGAFQITRRHLVEWLKLKDAIGSKRAFLHLWRSGHAPLSYMQGYQVFEALKARSDGRRLYGDKALYTKPGKGEVHAKLEYLKTDLLADGEIGNYLWIPPTRPYYAGGGIYARDVLKERTIKKGLIFSSWTFVPRYVAAELSAWQNGKRSRKGLKHPLKDTLRNWGRFWHPSPWLASIITHADFLSAPGRYEDLHKIAKQRIATALKDKGWQVGGTSARPWEVLYAVDVKGVPTWADEIGRAFKKTRNEFIHREVERGGALPLDQLDKLLGCDPQKVVSRAVVAELAHIALASPAVCLLRALYSLGVLSAESVDGHQMAVISDFCARNWKMFFNRENTAKAIAASYRGGRSFADKLQSYLKDGNIQSVLDEYIYHIQPGRQENAYKEVLHKLALVFGPKGGALSVRVSARRKERVSAEQITSFGRIDELTQSRNSIREAFNSPFWPFVLVSTSVGQEGLDFHLYCKDIYHWNLPSNPVDFEQREGRINRFNSYWVRSVIAKSVEPDGKSGFYWERLYKEAPKRAHRNDRFNLGMSPHWTYTPVKEVKDRGYNRHILAIPGTEERSRYESLMKDLSLYRLTLGQPDQSSFLNSLKNNAYLNKIDPRSVTLCLFPYNHSFIHEHLKRQHDGKEAWDLLINDALGFLDTLRKEPQYQALAAEVRRHTQIVKGRKSGKEIGASIAALLHFVNPHDEVHDRTPNFGLEDDLERLKAANAT